MYGRDDDGMVCNDGRYCMGGMMTGLCVMMDGIVWVRMITGLCVMLDGIVWVRMITGLCVMLDGIVGARLIAPLHYRPTMPH